MADQKSKIIKISAIAVGVVGVAAGLWFLFGRKTAEVFAVGSVPVGSGFHQAEAAAVAKRYGTLATMAQLTEAQKKGASWCAAGWTMGDDGKMHVAMPLDAVMTKQCVGSKVGVNDVPLVPEQMDTYLEYVNVYGIKPKIGLGPSHSLVPWNAKKFSQKDFF